MVKYRFICMPAYIPPFSWIYISPADEVYIHWQLQYIFNCRCSIYSFFGYTILYGLFCLPGVRGAACRAFGAMRFWPPWMMQASLGLSRPWSFSSFFIAGLFPPVSAIAGNRGCWARPGRYPGWHSGLLQGLGGACKGHRTG